MLHMFQKPGVFQSVMWLAICTACLILVLCHYWHILIGNRVSTKLTGYSSLIAPQTFGYSSYGIALGLKK
jgi:hypothetical protein